MLKQDQVSKPLISKIKDLEESIKCASIVGLLYLTIAANKAFQGAKHKYYHLIGSNHKCINDPDSPYLYYIKKEPFD